MSTRGRAALLLSTIVATLSIAAAGFTAPITTYTDPAAFQSDHPIQAALGFEEFPPGTDLGWAPVTLEDITLASAGRDCVEVEPGVWIVYEDRWVVQPGGGVGGSQAIMSSLIRSDTVSVAGGGRVEALGLHFYSGSIVPVPWFRFTATDVDGDTAQYLWQGVIVPDPEFVGFHSASGITRIVVEPVASTGLANPSYDEIWRTPLVCDPSEVTPTTWGGVRRLWR
jgi:hypothetical protein